MKVKIIYNDDVTKAEDEVNRFIENKVIHDIKHTAMAIPKMYHNGVPSSMRIMNSFMIMYDEPEDIYSGNNINALRKLIGIKESNNEA